MTPALSAFYAGLGRIRNGIDVMMQVWICFAVVGVIWIIFGFSMAYDSDLGGIIGGMDFMFLENVGLQPHNDYGKTIPFILFFFLQIGYAIITPALIAGAMLERIALKAYIAFIVLWSIIVYIPLAHIVWGGGFLMQIGFIDAGGGTVIHGSAGFSSLAAALVLGKRLSLDDTPHNMIQVSVNCGILLFGWFAFNAAGSLAVNGNCVYAMVNSIIGTIVGMAVWVILTLIREKHPSFLNAMFGFLAGLIAVTPGCAYMNTQSAALSAFIISILCYIAVNVIRPVLGFDDTLDVWGLHGVGGFFGCILIPVFSDAMLVDMQHNLVHQMVIQIVGTVATCGFAFIVTILLLKGIERFTALRVKEEIEGNVDILVYDEKIYS